jgi:hypothetical protein
VDEEPPVVVIQEEVLAAIVTGHNLARGVDLLAAKAARNDGLSAKKPHFVNYLHPDPVLPRSQFASPSD